MKVKHKKVKQHAQSHTITCWWVSAFLSQGSLIGDKYPTYSTNPSFWTALPLYVIYRILGITSLFLLNLKLHILHETCHNYPGPQTYFSLNSWLLWPYQCYTWLLASIVFQLFCICLPLRHIIRTVFSMQQWTKPWVYSRHIINYLLLDGQKG